MQIPMESKEAKSRKHQTKGIIPDPKTGTKLPENAMHG
jgi:hypothetical protein